MSNYDPTYIKTPEGDARQKAQQGSAQNTEDEYFARSIRNWVNHERRVKGLKPLPEKDFK